MPHLTLQHLAEKDFSPSAIYAQTTHFFTSHPYYIYAALGSNVLFTQEVLFADQGTG